MVEEVKREEKKKSKKEKEDGPTLSDVLQTVLMNPKVKLWQTPEDSPVASFSRRGGPYQTHPINSRAFRGVILDAWYSLCHGPTYMESRMLASLVEQLEIHAEDSGNILEWNLRIVEHEKALYVDLGTPKWDCIKVSGGDWEIVPASPVPFLRGSGIQPFYFPQRGGSVDLLRKYINYGSEEQFKLIVAFMVCALDKKKEYPILSITGVSRSGKTTLTNIINSLIQGIGAENAQIMPNSIRDIGVTARNNWLVSFENISSLSFKVSDALCQLSTGFTLRERKLYYNGEEFGYTVYRPVILNGINNVISRNDLMRRAINIRLPQMEDADVENKELIMDEFEQDAPLILGALLSAVAYARANRRRSSRKPSGGLVSMCDFIESASPSLGWKEGEFVDMYDTMLNEMRRVGMENDLLTRKLVDIVEQNGGCFVGCHEEFMEQIEVHWRSKYRGEDWFPKTPQRFANHLDRVSPDMERVFGVRARRMKRDRYNGRMVTTWCIEKI